MLGLVFGLLLAGCAARPGAAPSTTLEMHPERSRRMRPLTSPSTSPRMELGRGAEAVDLNVFAAASLRAAFEEIGARFEAAHPGANVLFNFAGSQQLAQQIHEGAPADVFASANQAQMNVAIEAGSVVTGTQQTFVKNRLVLVYPRDNPGGLAELQDLARPGLKLVLAAREVPAGQYSLELLDKATTDPGYGREYKDAVLENVVSYEDNVKIVLTKVALGEADAGIVYTSDVTGPDAAKVGQIEIPDALNVVASYPIAPVKESENPKLAQAFIDLVLAPEGQEILAKHGFVPAESPPNPP